MKRSLKQAALVMAFVALTSGSGASAQAGMRSHANPDPKGAAATTLPFKGTLEGRHISRTPLGGPVVVDRFEAQGHATQLGRFQLVIAATVNFGSRPVTGVGTYTFTAANGDQLVASHTGSSTLVGPGLVLITERATIDPDRSTGRFAGAGGTFTVERFADAATGVGGLTVGAMDGTIRLST